MRTDSQLIALKIGQALSPGAASVRAVLDRALALAHHAVVTVESEAEREALGGRLDRVRTGLADAMDAEAVQRCTDDCFDVCEQAIELLRMQQHQQKGELRRLVALVRDTVALLASDGDAFSSDITQAAGRFTSLLRVSDLQQLKQRLAAEVSDLQRIATERQQQWRRSVEMFESRIATLERQLDAVKREASLDALTGIPNRRHFEQRVREALQGPERQVVVAVLDLDDFKSVNDTGGHAAGDVLLRVAAQTLTSSVRREDVVARIGGDEFAVLGVGVTLRDAERRLRTILATLAALPTGVAHPAHVATSCGLAEYSAGDTLESILRRADQALYEAKRQGKGRLVVKSPPFIRDLLRGNV
jgi:diguanylate cyclase (GGDEF)-like protein